MSSQKYKIKTAMFFKAEEYHQNFYEISSDWNKYYPDEHQHLKKFISTILHGPNFYQIDDASESNNTMNFTNEIYTLIVQHGTQLSIDKEILCNVLYNFTYNLDSVPSNGEILNDQLYIYPIFKIKKNFKNQQSQTWYIDTAKRVYKSWADYIRHNVLPACIMLVPKDGIYQANLKELWSDQESIVWIESHVNKSKIITNVMDKTNTYINIGCIGVSIAAMVTPVALPVVTAATVGSIISGIWGGSRSLHDLVDRHKHHQSINVNNKQALKSWVGVVGSTLGVMAASSSTLLSRAIRKGTFVSKGAQVAHDTIMISSLVVNSGPAFYLCVSSIIEKFKTTGEISHEDIFFLTTHALLCYNCVMNWKCAANIIKSGQDQILKDYENSLRSKKHVNEFRRLVRNTEKNIPDINKRNSEIIRTLTKIDNKDQFFTHLVRNRKIFNAAGIKVSFSNGQLLIDDVNKLTLISPSTFLSNINSNLNQISNPQVLGTTGNTISNNNHSGTYTLNSKSDVIATIAVVKDFCSQTNIMYTELCAKLSPLFKNVNNNERVTCVVDTLLKGALYITKRLLIDKMRPHEIIRDALNFIWDLTKSNFLNQFPDYNILVVKFEPIVRQIIKKVTVDLQNKIGEWTATFKKYISQNTSDTLNPDLVEFLNRDSNDYNNESIYSEITAEDRLNIVHSNALEYNNEVIPLNPEIISEDTISLCKLIIPTLDSTGSKMNKFQGFPFSENVINMYISELDEYFLRHPISYDFQFIDLLYKLNGILADLENFKKKNIIFYKLIALSILIENNELDNPFLEKDTLVYTMKFMWTFVNIRLSQIMPQFKMFNNQFEDLIIYTIIEIYQSLNTDREKWLKAFNNYKHFFLLL